MGKLAPGGEIEDRTARSTFGRSFRRSRRFGLGKGKGGFSRIRESARGIWHHVTITSKTPVQLYNVSDDDVHFMIDTPLASVPHRCEADLQVPPDVAVWRHVRMRTPNLTRSDVVPGYLNLPWVYENPA